MNNRERVLTALVHKQPDKVPYNIEFTQQAHANMVEFYGDPDFVSKIGNCLNVVRSRPLGGWKEIEPDIWVDDFGVLWNRSVDKDIGTVWNQLVTPENVHSLPFPDPDAPQRFVAVEAAVKDKGDQVVLYNLGFSLFERAWVLAGMENLLMAMLANPKFAHALLDRILEWNLRVIENVCAFDIDILLTGDDWGMQTGLLMGPKLWREFIKPRIRQMYALTKSKGKYVAIHSCGKVDQLFPELIECGVDIFNPFQPEVMDVFDVKRRYGDRLSFYGGISIQRTLPHGTVDQVREEVKRLLDQIGQNGGYIAGPSHEVPRDAKPENLAAMIEVLQDQ
jgi:uroporphyrinogen decarboxylase